MGSIESFTGKTKGVEKKRFLKKILIKMKLPAASGRGIKAELRRSHFDIEMI
jgi:hypothetical protein